MKSAEQTSILTELFRYLRHAGSLVDKSLVTVQEADAARTLSPAGNDAAIWSGTSAGKRNTAEIFRRHGDYFLSASQRRRRSILPGPQQVDWLNRLEADHDNLRLALTRPADDESGLQLASALVHFWKLRGYLREGSEWLSRTVDGQ